MNYVNTNRINNLLPRYCIENTEENFKKLEHVIEKKILRNWELENTKKKLAMVILLEMYS